MRDHQQFKQTEIGRIPKEWKVVRLEEVIQEIKNGFASGKRDKDGIVQIRMNNVTTDGHLIFDSFLKVPVPESINGFLLKKNDFLFNNTNSIDLVGKSAIFKNALFPCTFSNHFTRIRFTKEVIPEWVLFHFITLWEKGFFKSVAIRHVGQSAVHTRYLLNLNLPLPPLPEQKKIAEILSTVDKAIERVDEAIEKTKRLKRGLMQELLTKGIGHKEFKNTEIGRIPKEWEVVKLGNSTEVIMGQSPSGDTYNEKMEGLPLINGPSEFGEVRPITFKWTTNPTKTSRKGDVFICVRGHTTGRLNISDGVYCIGRGVAVVRSKEKVSHNLFIYYILEKNREKIYGISYAAGSTFPNITSVQLSKFSIPLPPLPEQKKIAEILSTVDKRLELLRKRKEKLERVKRGLMDDLLSGKKRVTSLISKEA